MTRKIFPIDESLGFWMYRMHIQRVNALRKAFQTAGYDLTTEQWALLARMREHEGMNQNQLAEKTFKDRHNITRILNLLEKRGYIERRPDNNDKRAYRLFLTETGRAIQEELSSIVLKHRAGMLKGLSPKDLQKMRSLLKQIVSNLEKRLAEMSKQDRTEAGKKTLEKLN